MEIWIPNFMKNVDPNPVIFCPYSYSIRYLPIIEYSKYSKKKIGEGAALLKMNLTDPCRT